MGTELDIDDVVAGNPKAEAELQDLRDQNAALRAALYDEQHGITATLRQNTEQRMRDALKEARAAIVCRTFDESALNEIDEALELGDGSV